MTAKAHNKANQRQSRKNEGYYKNQFFKTARNKIRKIKKALARNPNDAAQAASLEKWQGFYDRPVQRS